MFDTVIKDFLSGKIYEIIFGILAIVMLYGLSGLFVTNFAKLIIRLIIFFFKFPVLLTIRIIKYFCGKQSCVLCKTYSGDTFKSKCCKQMFHTNCVAEILSTPPKCPKCNMFSDSKFYEIGVYNKVKSIHSTMSQNLHSRS
jgi:hypothetical protein